MFKVQLVNAIIFTCKFSVNLHASFTLYPDLATIQGPNLGNLQFARSTELKKNKLAFVLLRSTNR